MFSFILFTIIPNRLILRLEKRRYCFMKTGYSFEEINALLDAMAQRFNTPEFIETDPVQFPRKFSLKQDVEISALLTAAISWGKRSIILKSASSMHGMMGYSPYDYVMGKGYEKLGKGNIHRTFFEEDMAYFCRGLHLIYNRFDSLEDLFGSIPPSGERVWEGLLQFRMLMENGNGQGFDRSLKHISDPRSSSACKRLHLALRWLVRNDGIVDIGLWNSLSPSELKIPLDTHVGNVSRRLGLLYRNQNDRKAVEELTERLKRFNPADPVIYDFALFGIGESKTPI